MVAVNAAGWRTGYRDFVAPEVLETLPVEQWHAEISAGLASPRGDSFSKIAEADGEFAGYCFVAAPGRDGDLAVGVAELVAIYVDPERWGGGAGSALISAGERGAADAGYAEIVLWTFADNARGLRFYERHGWSPDGAERTHPRTRGTSVRLRKRIGQT